MWNTACLNELNIKYETRYISERKDALMPGKSNDKHPDYIGLDKQSVGVRFQIVS